MLNTPSLNILIYLYVLLVCSFFTLTNKKMFNKFIYSIIFCDLISFISI